MKPFPEKTLKLTIDYFYYLTSSNFYTVKKMCSWSYRSHFNKIEKSMRPS